MRRWHILTVIIFLAINTVGSGIIYWRLSHPLPLSSPKSLEAVRLTTAEIADKLVGIQDQLTRLQASDSNSGVLGATASSGQTGQLSDLLPYIPNSTTSTSISYVTISKNFTDPVNVYKEQADFSSTIGQLIPGQKYPYDVKLNGWYQVNLSDGNKSGWVKAEQVEESL